MHHVQKCTLPLHGAGPTPRAIVDIYLPVQENRPMVLTPACEESLRALQQDAAKDGATIAFTRRIGLKPEPIAQPE